MQKWHAADIDPQFERSGSDQRADFSSFQFSLGDQSQLTRQTAVMLRDGISSQAFAEMMRHALGQTPRVDKNKSGTMLRAERGDAIVDLVPHFVGRYRAKLAAGNLDSQVEFAPMADLHDKGERPFRAGQEIRNKLDGLLRGGKTDAWETLAGQMVEPFERKSQVRATLVVGDRVDFVHNNGFNSP